MNHKFENWSEITKRLNIKCELKNKIIDTNLFDDEKAFGNLSRSWERSIAHHLPAKSLPEFEEVWNFLRETLFRKYLKF